MFTPSPRPFRNRQTGISVVELIMFIVIVSIAVVGILSVMNITTRHSADPMQRKQAIAIAESLMEEITQMPFTFCDPDDPNNLLPTPPASSADCTGGAGGGNDESNPLGPDAGEGRATATPFDNVADYNGFTMTGIQDITTGTVIPALAGYNANVTVAQSPLGPAGAQASGAASLLITVIVTPPTGAADSITLHGYRTRYAPNAGP